MLQHRHGNGSLDDDGDEVQWADVLHRVNDLIDEFIGEAWYDPFCFIKSVL